VSERRSLGFRALQGFAATHLLFLHARAWQVAGFHHLHARDCWLDFWKAGFPPSPARQRRLLAGLHQLVVNMRRRLITFPPSSSFELVSPWQQGLHFTSFFGC